MLQEYETLDIFNMMFEEFKLDKNKDLYLIELFAGYGSQSLALDYLGVNYKNHKICEWAVNSIIAYSNLHATDSTDYSEYLTKEEIAKTLAKMGVSIDYNKPATMDQLKRMGEKKLKECYNAIKRTHNLVDVSRVKGQDLEIDPHNTYLLTYSFPCQDLSLAGKRKGMETTETRSGLLWEVERILIECKSINRMPNILLMENVPAIHSEKDMPNFKKWILKLEELGYQNYWEDMIATDYGIPQTRNRTFMVSILGDYSYTFPKKTNLEIKLKDLLENDVDEKFFLSDKMLNYMYGGTGNLEKYDRKAVFMRNFETENVREIASTITTNAGNRPTDNFIKIKNNNSKGYLEATDGDDIDISSRMQYHRGTVQKGKAQTLTTQGKDVGVVVNMKQELCNKLIKDGLVEESDVIKHSYTQQIMDGKKKCIEKNDGSMITLTTRGDCYGVVVAAAQRGRDGEQQMEISDRETANTITTAPKDSLACEKKVIKVGNYMPSGHNSASIVDKEGCAPTVMENHGTLTATNVGLRIRKLTPRECFRLMGLKDSDYDKIAVNQSQQSLYHLAGDSIVVNVLMAIFSKFYDLDYNKYFIPEEWWIINKKER